MNFLIYFGIFSFKIIEDALSTLRLIVVSNGKKLFGAILQFIVTIIWIVLTGSVLINFMKDFYKIIAFSLGSFFGSYIGSLIEEKIALGTCFFLVRIKKEYFESFISKMSNLNILWINNNDKYYLLKIIIPRKKSKETINTITNIDKESIIVSEKIKYFH